MNLNLRIVLAAVATVGYVTLAATNAVAADTKMYHGSDCKVFGATAWTDLHFSGYGVKNLASSARNIICPLIKDTVIYWDGEDTTVDNAAYVHMHVAATSQNAAVTCTVYVTNTNDSTTFESYAYAFGTITAGTNTYTTLGPLQSVPYLADHDQAYMLCTLGPQARLTGYNLSESAGTE